MFCHIFSNIAVKDDSVIYGGTESSIGESLTLTCDSAADTRWYFSKSNNLPMSTPHSYIKSIKIFPVELKDAGHYYCHGYYRFESHHFLAQLLLKVYGEFC